MGLWPNALEALLIFLFLRGGFWPSWGHCWRQDCHKVLYSTFDTVCVSGARAWDRIGPHVWDGLFCAMLDFQRICPCAIGNSTEIFSSSIERLFFQVTERMIELYSKFRCSYSALCQDQNSLNALEFCCSFTFVPKLLLGSLFCCSFQSVVISAYSGIRSETGSPLSFSLPVPHSLRRIPLQTSQKEVIFPSEATITAQHDEPSLRISTGSKVCCFLWPIILSMTLNVVNRFLLPTHLFPPSKSSEFSKRGPLGILVHCSGHKTDTGVGLRDLAPPPIHVWWCQVRPCSSLISGEGKGSCLPQTTGLKFILSLVCEQRNVGFRMGMPWWAAGEYGRYGSLRQWGQVDTLHHLTEQHWTKKGTGCPHRRACLHSSRPSALACMVELNLERDTVLSTLWGWSPTALSWHVSVTSADTHKSPNFPSENIQPVVLLCQLFSVAGVLAEKLIIIK